MPTYTYKDTETGHRFEHFQSIHDEPLTVSPYTGNPVVKVLKPAPIHFKGAGWARNDSRGADKG